MTFQTLKGKRTKKEMRLMMMRQAKARATDRYSIGGVLKKGHHAPKPITLPSTPWDTKP